MFGGIEKWWDVSLFLINGWKGWVERIFCVFCDVFDWYVVDVVLCESEVWF